MDTAQEAMESALEILESAGFEYGGGLANHGPMAAEAMVRLGRHADVVPWTERYRRHLDDRPRAGDRIRADAWTEALGDGRRVGDWEAFFTERLDEKPWTEVVGEWVPRLLPGLVAAALHGVIRTGHAVRALEAAETPRRHTELARGLAYWAAHHQRLPGRRTATTGIPPGEAIERIVLLPQERRSEGLLVFGLMALDDWPPFRDVVDLVDLDDDAGAGADLDRVLGGLTRTFVRTYLANAHDFFSTIAFVHGVTGPAAVRLLLPHLDVETGRLAVAGAWQAGAAVYAAFGSVADPGPVPSFEGDVAAIVERAVDGGDEHAIKFTEACLREHALEPDPAYLAAADHAVGLLGGS